MYFLTGMLIGMLIGTVLTVALVALLTIVYRALTAAHAAPQVRPGPGLRAEPPAGAEAGRRGLVSAVGGTIRLLLRAGVPLGPVMLLNVRGRTSGLPRTNSVDVFERNGRRWLVATHHGEAQWVRNLRVAGEGTLTRGRRRLAFTTVELSPEDAGTVLRDVLAPRLGRPLGGLVLRQTLNVPADATPAAFAAAAEHHPVFELTVRGRTEVVGTRNRRHPSGVPLAVIGVGVLTVLIHLALAVTTAMATPQWVSGIVIGLLVAGLGNHLRLFRHG